MKHLSFRPSGVCSQKIDIDLNEENGTVENVLFTGGCSGNTQGIASLVRGMKVDDVIDRLNGIQCGFKGTSCPDQLAKALQYMKEQQ